MNYGTTANEGAAMDGDQLAGALIALAIFLLVALSLSGLGTH